MVGAGDERDLVVVDPYRRAPVGLQLSQGLFEAKISFTALP